MRATLPSDAKEYALSGLYAVWFMLVLAVPYMVREYTIYPHGWWVLSLSMSVVLACIYAAWVVCVCVSKPGRLSAGLQIKLFAGGLLTGVSLIPVLWAFYRSGFEAVS